jgi:hypothetical protein
MSVKGIYSKELKDIDYPFYFYDALLPRTSEGFMIDIGPIDHNGYTSKFVSYIRHQNHQKSFAEQICIVKNPGDIIVSVGEENMQGKSFNTVLKALGRARSVLKLQLIDVTLWAQNQCIVRSLAAMPENNVIPSEFHWIKKDTKYYVLDGKEEHPADVVSFPYYFENNWVVDIVWITTPERKDQKVFCSKVIRKLFSMHKRPVRVRDKPKRFIDETFGHVKRKSCMLNTSVEYSKHSQDSTPKIDKQTDVVAKVET